MPLKLYLDNCGNVAALPGIGGEFHRPLIKVDRENFFVFRCYANFETLREGGLTKAVRVGLNNTLFLFRKEVIK